MRQDARDRGWINVCSLLAIASAVFLLVEIMTLGLTSIWFAGGAVVAAITALFGVPFWVQMLDIYRGNMSVVCTHKTSCQTIFKQQGAKNEY